MRKLAIRHRATPRGALAARFAAMPSIPRAATKKGSSRCPCLLLRCWPRPATPQVLLRCCLAGSARTELLVELLDAACGVHDLLLAGVERMRFRRDFDLRERVGLAVEFGRFARLDGRARHELEVVRHIDEQDFAVIRVNAFFHGLSFNLAVANPRAAAMDGPHLGASHLPMVEKTRLCQKISRLTNFPPAFCQQCGAPGVCVRRA
ncbi:exported hypothetical protein [Paraburkholderia ribeironis]|uniref:Uncharacterized protein n=1 Tax=Paraburkholderia ribeironis TaxID=1247936 RepID=A0A1N7SGB7_9BURK|nr:exported hypothetical protein [Paraburkholderia ribeironis]